MRIGMQSWINRKRDCIPGAVYTSAPAYLPDPLFDFSEGLVPRLEEDKQYKSSILSLEYTQPEADTLPLVKSPDPPTPRKILEEIRAGVVWLWERDCLCVCLYCSLISLT